MEVRASASRCLQKWESQPWRPRGWWEGHRACEPLLLGLVIRGATLLLAQLGETSLADLDAGGRVNRALSLRGSRW